MKRFHTILHPTDFSPGSDAAFQYACDLARDYDARLVVVYAQGPIVPMPGEAVFVSNDRAHLREIGRRQLDTLQPTGPAVRIERVVRDGPAPDEILAAARESRADLIVMGTHGRSGIGRLVLGSVAEEVLRKAPCPVLAVKATAPNKATKPAVRPEKAASR